MSSGAAQHIEIEVATIAMWPIGGADMVIRVGVRLYDTQGLQRDDQLDQTYGLCGEMRDGADQFNAAIPAADKEGAVRAQEELEKSCNACHAAFRTAK
jgi:hypothetical protein